MTYGAGVQTYSYCDICDQRWPSELIPLSVTPHNQDVYACPRCRNWSEEEIEEALGEYAPEGEDD